MCPIFRRLCYAFLCAAVLAFTGCAQEETSTSENSGENSVGSSSGCCDAPSRDAVSASQSSGDNCCEVVTPSQPAATPANPATTAQPGGEAKVDDPAP